MAAVTDKFIKGPANHSTTLSSSINDSVQTIPLSDVTGVPTDTAVYIAVDAHDANGNATPSDAEVIKGVISGSNLINASRGEEGTAQSHDSGAVVEFFFTAAANNDIVDGILEEHKQTGAHSDITADSIVVADAGTLEVDTVNEATSAAGVTVDGLLIKDGKLATNNSVVTANITNAAVDPAKWTNPYCFRAYDSGGTTLNDNTVTQINLATESYDYNNNFASSAYTAPVAGVYHFDGSCLISTSEGIATVIAHIYVDGVEVAQNRIRHGGSMAGQPGVSISADLLLDATDVVTFRVTQDSDGAEATQTGATNTFFSGHLVHQVL